MNTSIPKIVINCEHHHPSVNAARISINATHSMLIIELGRDDSDQEAFYSAGIEPILIPVEAFDEEEASPIFYSERFGWNVHELACLVDYLTHETGSLLAGVA